MPYVTVGGAGQHILALLTLYSMSVPTVVDGQYALGAGDTRNIVMPSLAAYSGVAGTAFRVSAHRSQQVMCFRSWGQWIVSCHWW